MILTTTQVESLCETRLTKTSLPDQRQFRTTQPGQQEHRPDGHFSATVLPGHSLAQNHGLSESQSTEHTRCSYLLGKKSGPKTGIFVESVLQWLSEGKHDEQSRFLRLSLAPRHDCFSSCVLTFGRLSESQSQENARFLCLAGNCFQKANMTKMRDRCVWCLDLCFLCLVGKVLPTNVNFRRRSPHMAVMAVMAVRKPK